MVGALPRIWSFSLWEKIASIILCLLFFINTIKWVSSSISYLPESLFDYSDSQSSYFCGIKNKNKKT
jgi:hypothetical protein